MPVRDDEFKTIFMKGSFGIWLFDFWSPRLWAFQGDRAEVVIEAELNMMFGTLRDSMGPQGRRLRRRRGRASSRSRTLLWTATGRCLWSRLFLDMFGFQIKVNLVIESELDTGLRKLMVMEPLGFEFKTFGNSKLVLLLLGVMGFRPHGSLL